MKHADTLQRFLFEEHPIRGELVHLDTSYRAIRDHHRYPPGPRRLLGEALAAVTLLSGSIKAHDALILQAQGTGPLRLVVAQCTSRRSLRGLARWSGGELPPGRVEDLLGEGRVVITIDPGQGKERYQGMVALAAGSLADSLETYFAQSEQLPTRLWLACDGQCAAGLLLQRIPGEESDADAWNRLSRLAATVSHQELLGLGGTDLLRRLFHEEDVRAFEPERTTFGCSCSRETIGVVLRSLGRKEIEEVLREQGRVSVTCDFCNRLYEFDAVDVEGVFRPAGAPAAPATRH
jgi:molecular chaperone Hsp33